MYFNLFLISLILLFIIYLFIFTKEDFVSKSFINKYYVISLNNKKGREKWKYMKRTSIGTNLEKVSAIDGRLININEYVKNKYITRYWDLGKWKYGKSKLVKLSPTEIGCCLSHLKIWNIINKNNIEKCIIFEDDAHYMKSNFKQEIDNILDTVPKDWDIILLGYMIKDNSHKDEIKIGTFYKIKQFFLTHCYLIKLKGVRRLLTLLPINAPIDTWLSSHSNKINIYRHNITNGKANRFKNIHSHLIRQNTNTFKGEIDHTNTL